MYFTRERHASGFTIVELIVVIGIIALLLAVVLANMSDARANARDKERQSDIAQIQLAAKLYQQTSTLSVGDDANRDGLPDAAEIICADATECPGTMSGAVRNLVGLVEDPRHDGSSYYYHYDGSVTCDGPSQIVAMVAANMETGAANNFSSTCSTMDDIDPLANGVTLIIGDSEAHHAILR